MRHFAIILLVFLLVGFFVFPAGAQTINWSAANKAVVAWDPVTQTINDTPFPAEDTITYKLYLLKDGADPAADAIFVDETDQTTYTLTLDTEGRWLAGVQSVRQPAGETVKQESAIAWSSDPVYTNQNPFGFVYYEVPKPPGGLTK